MILLEYSQTGLGQNTTLCLQWSGMARVTFVKPTPIKPNVKIKKQLHKIQLAQLEQMLINISTTAEFYCQTGPRTYTSFSYFDQLKYPISAIYQIIRDTHTIAAGEIKCIDFSDVYQLNLTSIWCDDAGDLQQRVIENVLLCTEKNKRPIFDKLWFDQKKLWEYPMFRRLGVPADSLIMAESIKKLSVLIDPRYGLIELSI